MTIAPSSRPDLLVIPEQLADYSFTRTILHSHHGSLVHKTLHEDLRALEFISSQPCIGYLIKGRERFRDGDGTQTVLDAEEMVLIPPNQRLQSDFRGDDGPLEAILIFLGVSVIRDVIAHAPAQSSGRAHGLLHLPRHAKLTAFMDHVIETYEDLRVNPELVRVKLTELLLLADTLGQPGRVLSALAHQSAQQPRRSVSDVTKTFAHHDLDTATLAAMTGRSVASFNREFRRRFGTSPAQWRKARRLERAKGLLRDTDETVTDIGLSVGYESTSHFIAQFKKQFGATPKQFRERPSGHAAIRKD